jgi:quaternary ammonium compound-resistance protein SugE
MELFFAALGGGLLGLAVRYGLPKRAATGVLLLPAVGSSVAAAAVAALTWAGWKFDGGWIWVVSLVAAGVVSVFASLLLGRQRSWADEEMLSTLSHA